MNMETNIQMVPIEDIIPNRFQPRLTFNEDGLNELSESIKQHGIIQPIVVRKLGDKFEIIAGERRYKAASQAGLTQVPIIVSDIDDNKSAEVALVENIQRRNLTSIEEAKSYKNLLDRGYLTQEQLANKMGVSQSTVANKLRLLNLDAEVQDALLNEKISERHARALLVLTDKEEQRKWLKKIIDERMTVRQLDTELKKLKNPDEAEDDSGIPLVEINPDLDKILNNAEDINAKLAPHNVANMLVPDEIEESKTEIPPIIEPEKTVVNTNKFFNFLEDEEANMNMGDSDDIFNMFKNDPIIPEEIQEEKVENEEVILSPVIEEKQEQVDTLDDELDTLEDIITEQNEEVNIPEVTNQVENSNGEINPFEPNFFQNTSSEVKEFPSPEVFESVLEEKENTPVIEEKKEEQIIDPIDSIVTLDPNYQEEQEIKEGKDLATAISILRTTVDDLNKKGFYVELEEADLDGIYQVTIKIDK